MFLKPYITCHQDSFEFTRHQASSFAKKIAGDFNPIHDEDSKRFCVPGDLLFSTLLYQRGISQHMSFTFSGMVTDGVILHINNKDDFESSVVDSQNKEYLHMTHSGDVSHNHELIEHVIKNYVQFSGMNFPHIMVPLMVDANMMINTQRPLVIYEKMEISFSRLDLTHPDVKFMGADFDVNGKRGIVTLKFSFIQDGEVIGTGTKRMVASGLRPYEAASLNDFVDNYTQRRESYVG